PATSTPDTTAVPPARPCPAWALPARSPTRAPPPPPGRTALARAAKPLLDERLGQAPPDDRPRRHHHRLLPLPRRRVRHRARTHPARSPPLPLGHPANHQTPQMTHLLPGALSLPFTSAGLA